MDEERLRRIIHLRRCTRTIIDKLEPSGKLSANARKFLGVGELDLALEGIFLHLVRHPELHDLLDDDDEAFLRELRPILVKNGDLDLRPRLALYPPRLSWELGRNLGAAITRWLLSQGMSQEELGLRDPFGHHLRKALVRVEEMGGSELTAPLRPYPEFLQAYCEIYGAFRVRPVKPTEWPEVHQGFQAALREATQRLSAAAKEAQSQG